MSLGIKNPDEVIKLIKENPRKKVLEGPEPVIGACIELDPKVFTRIGDVGPEQRKTIIIRGKWSASAGGNYYGPEGNVKNNGLLKVAKWCALIVGFDAQTDELLFWHPYQGNAFTVSAGNHNIQLYVGMNDEKGKFRDNRNKDDCPMKAYLLSPCQN